MSPARESQASPLGPGVGRVITPRYASGDRGVLRIARLLPLVIFAFEFRSVLVRLAVVSSELHRAEHAYTHSVGPWIVTLLAFGAAWMLREAARGVSQRLAPPCPSSTLVGRWLVCSALLVAVLCGHELCRELVSLGHSGRPPTLLGSATWSSLPVAVLVGCVLAASLRGARWILREVRSRRRALPRSRSVATPQIGRVALAAVPAPLLAGWSDRGPPAGRRLATV